MTADGDTRTAADVWLRWRWGTASAAVAGAAAMGQVVSHGDAASAQRWGIVVLTGSLIIGIPHGGTDAFSPSLRGADTVTWLARLVCYAGAAGAVLAAWVWLPAATLVALLVVAAVHFGVSDAPDLHDSSPRQRLRAAGVLGVLPVCAPIAMHPHAVTQLLADLSDGRAHLVIEMCRWACAVAMVGVAGCVVSAWRRRSAVAAAEPLALVAVFITAPPLMAFAMYYGLWHCTRQTVAAVMALQQDDGHSVAVAARRWGLRAALPSVAVAAAASLELRWGASVPVVGLIGVLALLVPHSITAALDARSGGRRQLWQRDGLTAQIRVPHRNGVG